MSDRVHYLKLEGRAIAENKFGKGLWTDPGDFGVRLIDSVVMSGVSHQKVLAFWQCNITKVVFWADFGGYDFQPVLYPVNWEYNGDLYLDYLSGGQRKTEIRKAYAGKGSSVELHEVWSGDEDDEQRVRAFIMGWAYEYWSYDQAERECCASLVVASMKSAPKSYTRDCTFLCENADEFEKDEFRRRQERIKAQQSDTYGFVCEDGSSI